MTAGSLAYVDASAFVKLVVSEPESEALIAALATWPQRVSSALLVVEGVRATARVSDAASQRAESLLAGLTLVPVSIELLRSAARLDPARLRSLDAIHLATARSLGDDLGVLFAYDERLSAAASESSMRVEVPA